MNKILKQFFQFSYGNFISLALSVFTVPVVTRLISPEQFGIASLALVFVNFATLVVLFGGDQTLARYYYDLFGAQKRNLLWKLGKVSIFIYSVLSIISLIYFKQISLYFFGSDTDIMPLVAILGITGLNVLQTYFRMLIRMEKRGNAFSFQIILTKLVKFICTVVLLKWFSNSYSSLLIAELLAIMLGVVYFMHLTRPFWIGRKLPKLPMSFKELFSFGWPVALSTFIFVILQSIDQLVLKYFYTAYEVGMYAGGYRLVTMLQIFVTAFVTYWVPLSYEKYKEDENKRFFEQAFSVVYVIAMLVVLTFIASNRVIVLLLGNEFHEASAVIPLLIFIPAMQLLTSITNVGINFRKRTDFHIIVTSLVLFISIVLNIILTPILGMRGASIAASFTYVVYFISYTVVGSRFFSIKAGYTREMIVLIISYCLAIGVSFEMFDIAILRYIAIVLAALVIYGNFGKLLRLANFKQYLK